MLYASPILFDVTDGGEYT